MINKKQKVQNLIGQEFWLLQLVGELEEEGESLCVLQLLGSFSEYPKYLEMKKEGQLPHLDLLLMRKQT